MMGDAEDIAVVGIGCNFPGGEGLDNFWKVLLEGKNCALQIPDERFDSSYWYDPNDDKVGKSRTDKAALMDGFNEFDHKFFGITETEVEQMDPQQKLLLQCAYRALENAGMPMEKASGTKTGVFIGLMNRDYEQSAAFMNPNVINHCTGTGLSMSIAANRVSYVFNFTGPSLSIDCACSSSLVALHLACQAIRQGDCEMALCGGVNCIIQPLVFVALSKAKMISPEGTSKPFSSRADGYGRGEGCGIILLKPLKKALKENDHVWGIISNTAVNQDGHTVTPITKPSMVQQEELLRGIYSESDLLSVQYIEAHGTGTPVGDPIEAGSISKVIAKARPPGSEILRIGSVKGNIGHTESAAGVAGLIKVLLMMKHETIVPSLFYSEDSASIDAKALNVKIPTKAEKWRDSIARVAGINNFGFGGTNAHAIVKQHKQSNVPQKSGRKSHNCFVLSASSEKSMSMMMEDTIQQIDTDNKGDLEALAYTSACRRSHLKHRYRRAFRTLSLADLKDQLKSAMNKVTTPSYSDPRLVFVFCGNGVTYQGMCQQLLKHEPVFREKISQIEMLFQKFNNMSIIERLESDSESKDLSKPDVVQPLLFAIQVGIASLFKHWGIKPDAILGHSVGEVAAAHCSGLLSLEDAVKVIYFRSTLQNKVTGGKMLVVSNMVVSEVLNLLPSYSDKISLAAFNSPQSCTLSGYAEAIDSLHQKLSSSVKKKNLFLRVLDVPAAYHSQMMDPILSQLEDSIGSLQVNDVETELFSTVTGREVEQPDFSTGKYWARNIREPVSFEQAVRSAAKVKKNVVFVEIGPRRALQRNIQETLGNDTIVLSSVQPDKDHETMLNTVSKLFELGVQVDWDQFYRGREASPTPFPRYQFDSTRRDVIIAASKVHHTSGNHPVLTPTASDSNTFSCDLSSDSVSYLHEHKHNGVAIIPGAFYTELGLAAFMASAKPKVPLNTLQLSVSFQSPYVFTQNAPEIKVQLEPAVDETHFKIYSPSTNHASGTITSKRGQLAEEQNISLSSIYKRCNSVLSSEKFYTKIALGGFQYGTVFQNKGDVHYGEEFKEAFSVVTVPEELLSQLHEYCIHPVVLDFLMQLAPVTVAYRSSSRPGFPVKIGSLTVFEPLQEEMIVYLKAIDEGYDHFEVCGCFTDKVGRVLVELKHVMITYLGSRSHVVEEYFFHNDFNVVCEDINSSNASEAPKALVFSDQVGLPKAMQPHLSSQSRYISFTQSKEVLSHGFPTLLANLNITDLNKHFQEVLFVWGQEDVTSLKTEYVLENMVSCCEMFRKIVLALRAMQFANSIRVITYRSAENTVDHISAGFVLSGMTRSCAAEMDNLSFQLIDINSVSTEDMRALSQVLKSYPCKRYPELVVKGGLIWKPDIVHTPIGSIESTEGRIFSSMSEPCIFQTNDPCRITSLSAIPCDVDDTNIHEQSVKIQLSKICVHSSDYYPVSVSDLNYGQTIYWKNHTSQKHQLLALDFSGTVTAVGKDVNTLKVGDHIVSCYPIAASSKIVIPEAACYKTKRLTFLKEAPCVSYFVLAWEILHRLLPRVKHRRLSIISSVPDSSLLKVLIQTANKSGWNAIVGTPCNGMFVDAILLLPPFDKSLLAEASNCPDVRHVVIVCESQSQCLLEQSVFQNVKDSVHIQTLQMSSILQRGSLIAKRPHIYRLLKSTQLDRISFSLETSTFQKMSSGSIDFLSVEESESYFSSKTLSGVVLSKDDSKGTLSNIQLLPKPTSLFQKKSVYIVTGGLSGLGFETVKFLSQKGGEYIVILSRSSPTPDIQQEIVLLERQWTVQIVWMGCDVSVSEHVLRVIGLIGQKFPSCPIKGVFHSAVVLHDGLIETLDKSHFEKVLKPKVNGALNLHHATKHCKLDYFVCYSSISSFLGNASQTNYAAANSFLDYFCHYRRNIGLSGQSINWGALNLGLLLNKDHLHRFLERRGLMVMDVTEIHESLEQCLLLNKPQQVVCRFHVKNMMSNVLSQNASLTMRMTALVDEAVQKLKFQKSQSEHTSVPSSPSEYIRSVLSQTIGVDKNELDYDSPLSALGIDSMLAMTLQNLIFQDRGVNVPLVTLLDPNGTLSTLVSMLMESTEGESQNDDQKEDMTDDMFTRL
ncbi:highly reducing polyketide synthase alt5 isoform X1 [Salmo salar]|uniref:Highly reducing polyketide synthase alt5-like isoform X1 n=1 Tax=Salmo salar TaxID=8030 RepID=A0ABM3DIW1_SALSA|nr:highly reducing polyketide synthase alt5-like isoform X1 [Salmo salar]XP_045558745.1 highly reducing polyketide synthase alt5-like isoform X1 [Salmo salar]